MAQIKDIRTIFVEEDPYAGCNRFEKFKADIEERTEDLIDRGYQPVGSPNLVVFDTGMLFFCQQFILEEEA